MGALIFLSAAGTHHRIPYLIRPRNAQPFSARRLWAELREAADNRNFRFFALAILAFLVARGISDGLGLFMGTYFWQLETRDMFQITSLALVGVFLGAPVWAGLVRWYEKRTIFLGGCVSLSLFTSLAPALKLVGWFPANESPWFLPLIYGVTFVTAMGVAGAVAVPGAMLADIADEHELVTGRRQEGIFFGAFSFAAKASTGLGGWLAGLALSAIGFPQPEAGGESVPPGSIDEGTLFALAMIAGPALGVFSLVGIWLASYYALDRRRHAEIVAELRSRGSGPHLGS
jgi:Na+/melibiose symporter-like transporter